MPNTAIGISRSLTLAMLYSIKFNLFQLIIISEVCLTIVAAVAMQLCMSIDKCVMFVLFVVFVGYGPSSATGGPTHRDGTRVGGSLHITDEAHTHYLNDTRVVCQ